MEQLAARRAHNPKVVGSSPTPATKVLEGLASAKPFSIFGPVAYLHSEFQLQKSPHAESAPPPPPLG